MKKKGQLTLILIIGLLLIIIATFVFVRLNQEKKDVIQSSSTDQISFELKKENFQDYFDQCSRDSIISANEEYGIRESNKAEYENYVSLKVKYCMVPLLDDFKAIDYNINEGSVKTTASFHEDTISVNVDYPISITKGEIGFDFETYKITFPRENFIRVVSMDDQEVLLPSTDKRAQIIVPAQTSITDSEGNPITSLSIKLIDKNFDGLENKVVVGNLIYEVSPSGAKFSKPIELSIDFRNKDIPQTVNENSLSIAWWDSSVGIWKGLPTTIKNGRAITKIDHLTKFAVVTGCGDISTYEKSIYVPLVFAQRYDHEKEWRKDNDDQYLPVGGNSNAVDTIQMLADESFEFGPEDADYCDGFVRSVCCCDSHEEIYDGTIYLGDKLIGCSLTSPSECSGEIADSDDEDIDACDGKRKGYEKFECMGGHVTDGDGDGAIFKLVFEDKGNSCFREFEVETFYFTGTKCDATVAGKIGNLVIGETQDLVTDPFTSKASIMINKVEVTRLQEPPEEGGSIQTNTTCDLKITLKGTGESVQISGIYEYDLTRECNNPGDYGYLEIGGIATCAVCELDSSGFYYYKPTEIKECCSADNERFAYCPGIIGESGKICVNKNGVYQFEDWNHPMCNYCCSDECKFESSTCPEKNNECDIVTCVD